MTGYLSSGDQYITIKSQDFIQVMVWERVCRIVPEAMVHPCGTGSLLFSCILNINPQIKENILQCTITVITECLKVRNNWIYTFDNVLLILDSTRNQNNRAELFSMTQYKKNINLCSRQLSLFLSIPNLRQKVMAMGFF